jgi:acyl dehydratase
MRELLGIDYRRILHGEQHLRYHAMAYAGDTLRFEPRIADIHDKKGGTLEFVRRETRVVNQRGELVAELTCVTVVRHAEPGRAAPPAPGHTAGEPAPRSDAVARAVAASHHDIQVGAELPPLEVEPVSRLTLALYCGASGDHNPIHVDTDYARAAGMDDVIAHGMLAMAYAARLVTGWVPQRAIERLSARFVAITQVGDALRCTATVAEKLPDRRVRLALSVADRNGVAKLVGDAVVVLS